MLKVDQHLHRLWTGALHQGLAICLRHSWVGLSLLDAGMLGLCWKINKNIFVQIRNGETSDDKTILKTPSFPR